MPIFKYHIALLFVVFSSYTFAIELKIATVSPDGSVWMTALRDAAKQIAAGTENRVRLKFYPGGVMETIMRLCVKYESVSYMVE